MSKDRPRNLVASVRDRLLQRAKRDNEDFQALLTRYCLERLLYRLSRSPEREAFVLKGAFLFALWSGRPHRPTKDLDLLGHGENSVGRLEQLFRGLCGQAVEDDGLVFRADSVRAERIKEDEEYGGVRVRCEARLGQARVVVQADVGFGDAVTPAPVAVTYPTLLDLPAPALPAYPRETVVAEKFQALVALGIGNSRLKDFYDLWFLARQFAFDGPPLGQAVLATFRRRRTPLPDDVPLALTGAFVADRDNGKQWQAFLRKNRLGAGGTDLGQVAAVLRDFLLPPARAVGRGEPFNGAWPAAGPWAPPATGG